MDCCDGLAAIERYCKNNPKGLTPVIEIAEHCDVEAIPDRDVGTHTVSTDITVATGKQFYSWSIADDDQLLSGSEGQGNATDMSFENRVTGFIPGDEDSVSAIINAIMNGSFIVAYQTKAGKKKLLGTKASPAKFISLSKANSPDSAGYLFTLSNKGEEPLNYTGAIPLTPVP